MMKSKCDDERCICCHPENMHFCTGPPGHAKIGDTYTCAECGAVWTCRVGRPERLPERVRWPKGQWWEADRKIPTKPELERRE